MVFLFFMGTETVIVATLPIYGVNNRLMPAPTRKYVARQSGLASSVPPAHNTQSWQLLEEYYRTLVSKGNELYIIAGVEGKGEAGDNGQMSSITSDKLTVPKVLWQVIVVLPTKHL